MGVGLTQPAEGRSRTEQRSGGKPFPPEAGVRTFAFPSPQARVGSLLCPLLTTVLMVVTPTFCAEVGLQATELGPGAPGSPACRFHTRNLFHMDVDVHTAIKIQALVPFLQRTLAKVNQPSPLSAGGREQQHNFHRRRVKWKKPFLKKHPLQMCFQYADLS